MYSPLGCAFVVEERVADVPEVVLRLVVLDFEVGDRRLAARTPVDDALATIDQALVVEVDEGGADRLRRARVEGEALARPVAGGAEALELVAYLAAVLLHPLPRALRERLAADVVAAEPFLRQLALDDVLRRDGGMVLSGQPEGRFLPHAMPAGEDVLQGDEEDAAEVEVAGDVRRRHDDGEGRPRGVDFGREEAGRLPEAV